MKMYLIVLACLLNLTACLHAQNSKSESDWRKEADERIEKHRKSDLELIIVDKKGNTVKDASVKVDLKKHHFQFGSAVSARNFTSENSELYKSIFLKYFNKAGFRNALKYKLRKNLAPMAEEVMVWFKENNIPVRGHTLIWPGWSHMPAEAESIKDTAELRAYCKNMVVEYAKKWDVVEWDVVNETRDNHDIMDIFGDEILIDWFKLAEANVRNKGARLYLNENKVISGPNKAFNKFGGPYCKHVKYLLDNNAPLDGLGIQSRFRFNLPSDTILNRLNIIAEYGLPILATEFEVKDSWKTTFTLEERAEITEQAMTILFSHPSVEGIIAWTLFSDEDHGLFYMDGTPRPQGEKWIYLTQEKWSTHEEINSDKDGKVALRCFKGDYEISVTHKGKTVKKEITVIDNTTIKITIE